MYGSNETLVSAFSVCGSILFLVSIFARIVCEFVWCVCMCVCVCVCVHVWVCVCVWMCGCVCVVIILGQIAD